MGDPVLLPPIRGRNGWDDPITGPEDLAVEVQNVDLYEGGIGEKRGGVEHVATEATTFGGNQWNDQTLTLAGGALAASQPGQTTTGRVLFIAGPSSVFQIRSGSTADAVAWAANPTADVDRAALSVATINGHAIFAVNTSENRVQVMTGVGTSGADLRFAALKIPAAPTAANTGSGSYAATLRYYRVEWREKSGSTIVRWSLLGPSVSFTPSGSGTHARVTQPTVASEGETHWAIYGSADDVLYYELAEVAIGTTTYDDNEAPADYDVNTAAPLEGFHTPFPSVKFVVSAFNRLMGFGNHETSAGQSVLTTTSTVYFSPPRGAEDGFVEEYIRNTVDEEGWLVLDENADGIDRALCGPLNNAVYAFKDRGIYAILPTDSIAAPFRSVKYTTQFGAVNNASTLIAEDEVGRPAIYFLDPRDGPRRLGYNGIEWLGKDVADVWATVNTSATTKIAHGLYVPSRKQVWWWVATGSSNVPNTMIVFNTTAGRRDADGALRGGWMKWTDFIAGNSSASATGMMGAVMFPSDLEDFASEDVPYLLINGVLNSTTAANVLTVDGLFRMDFDSTGDEIPTQGYQGVITTKAYAATGRYARVSRPVLITDAAANVSLVGTVIGNTSEGTSRQMSESVDLSPAGDETQVMRSFKALNLGNLWTWQLTIGDQAESSDRWRLHQIMAATTSQERV